MSNSVESNRIRNFLEKHCQSNGFPIHFYGDQIGTVLIGEEHYLFEKQQAELVEALKPSKLILEHLGGLSYDPDADTLVKEADRVCHDFDFDLIAKSLLTSHDDRPYGLRIFYELSRKYGIPILGCDLTLTEMLKTSFLDRGGQFDEIKMLINSPEQLGNLVMKRAYYERDAQMARFIYNHQGTPNNVSVAIIGRLHASYINACEILSNYASIDQTSVSSFSRKSLSKYYTP